MPLEPQSADYYRQMLTTAENRLHGMIINGKDPPASLLSHIEQLREAVAAHETDVILVDEVSRVD